MSAIAIGGNVNGFENGIVDEVRYLFGLVFQS
jgi:hypothetical protein